MHAVEPQFHDVPTGDFIIVQDEGQNVTFKCTASGIPVPQITWIANDRLVSPALNNRYHRVDDVIERKTAVPHMVVSELTVVSLREKDSGHYACRAESSVGQPAVLTKPFRLNVTKSN